MTTPTEARDLGQQRSLAPLSEDARETFQRAVRSLPIGRLFTINDFREELDTAQIPKGARGGLMAGAVKAGLCEEAREIRDGLIVVLHVPSTGASANASGVKVYRRTQPRKE